MNIFEKIKNKITFPIILNIIVIIISVTTVTYFFIDKNGLVNLLSEGQHFIIGWFLIAILAHIFNLFIDALTFKVFLKVRYDNISMWSCIKFSMIGQFFSAITPSATGGQPMQIYYMSKLDIEPGFSTSITIQKLIIYQLVTTTFSIMAIILRADYFLSSLNNLAMWIFTIVGFSTQIIFTLIVIFIAFNKKVATFFVNVTTFFIKKIKLIKNKDKIISGIHRQVDTFYSSNKTLMKSPKAVVKVYLLVFVQVAAILSIPYFIYRSLNFNDARLIDMVCSQSYVNLSVSMIPLPGASGAAEIGFGSFFSQYFGTATIKPAILLWRMITYYGTIFISAPFSRFTKDIKNKAHNKQN